MQNRTFRLFVSSTFSDFTQERSLLQTIVFPEIKKYCSSNKLNFQPIDLRWGVSSEAQLDQKTLELCLNEVKSSKLNPHPNFLIMAGDRYGWIPLPYLIEEKEFNTILEYVENSDDKKLLNTWYNLDENQLPASYILNERKDEYVEYSSWEEVEINLRNILQIAVNKSNLTNEQKNRYFTSATEAEVIEGIFKYLNKTPFQNKLLEKDNTLENKDYENVYAYIRNIKSISSLESKFKDKDLIKVNNFKNEIKKSISNSNILESNVNLINVSQDEKNGSLAYSYDEIKDKEDSIFVKTMINNLKKSIDIFVSQIKDISNDEIEKYEQIRFKDSKLKDFLPNSRVDALENIEDYISSNENQTLVVYGKSGLGKSSLMAKAIQNAEDKYNTSKEIIYRFVGSTANLSDTPTLLISILKDLNIQEEIKTISNPQTMKEEPEKIEEFYYRCYSHLSSLKSETIIFIDAIDQINNEDEFLWLPQTLPNNLKIIISALEDEKYPEDSIYFETLKTKTENLYPLEVFENPKELIKSLLSQYNRTITEKQMEYLLSKEDSNSPLYLSIATQELIHWKSYDNFKNLASTQKEIIKEFTQNLTTLFHHDEEFVKRVFTYLYLSQGLSESELLEIISTDEEFISIIAPETYHNNDTKELPVVIWARLHTQIKEFLKLENKDGQETMNFFHREFNHGIKDTLNIKEIHEHLIFLLQKLIIQYQNEPYDSNRWGILYIEIVKDYHISYEFSYLPDDNSNLKKYAEFFYKEIVNENYSEVGLGVLYIKGLLFQDINKIKEANFYFKTFYFSTFTLYKQNPQKWAGSYTTSLNNLASLLRDIGETSKAIELQIEALEIVKILYKYDPKSWTKNYIRNLHNLSALYFKGNSYEAIELDIEALEITKILYKENPQRWAKYYAKALMHLGKLLRVVELIKEGKKLISKVKLVLPQVIEESLDATALLNEAFVIIKELYKQDPKNYKMFYLDSLNMRLVLLKADGEKPSNEGILECLEITRKLYKEYPQRCAQTCINSLETLASSLKSIGDISKAIELQIEALDILKDLHKENPERWGKEYTKSLNDLASSLSDIEETSKAIELQTESLEITRLLYKKNNERWAEGYIDNLFKLSKFLKDTGDISAAMKLQSESYTIGFIFYRENPQKWTSKFLCVISSFSGFLIEIGETTDAIELQIQALEINRELSQNNPQIHIESYLRSLNHLAYSLKSIGDISKAIELQTESLNAIRNLYIVNSKEWLELYKWNLDQVSLFLRLIEETSNGIDLKTEIMEINRGFYKENDKAWAKSYITSLNDLAGSLNNIGKTTKAVELETESLYILKNLYKQNPQQWVEYYRISLYSLASYLKTIGETSKVIELEIEALEITKDLYKENPHKWSSKYTLSLDFLIPSLERIGETSKVIELQTEALEITKELVKENPQQWVEKHINTLNNLVYSLKKIGETSKVIELQTEALEITKELNKENPQKWAKDYTISLNDLANSFYKIKEYSKVVELGKEALEITKELNKENPQKWVEYYTASLNHLANSLRNIGKTSKAIELGTEALEITKELYKQNPEKWAEYYTGSSSNLSNYLNKIGETSKAIELGTEALEIRKELYKQNPQKWAEYYTGSLNSLANSLRDIGETSKAIELGTEALEITKELYKQNPEKWAEYYTGSSSNLSNYLNKIGETSKAIELGTEALEIRKELYKQNPQKWAEYYTASLNNLVNFFKKIGETSKAIELQTEALKIRKELYKKNPQRWVEAYTRSLNNLASSYLNIKDFKNSSYYFQEYFEIFDIDFIDNIDKLSWLVYPFVKYYQAKLILNEDVNSLDKYINEKVVYLEDEFVNDYEIRIKKEYEGYKKLANNSNDELQNQRLEIFEKIFIKEH